MTDIDRPDLQENCSGRQDAVAGSMTAEILQVIGQLLAAVAGPFKYQYLLLWLATLRRLVLDLIVEVADWSRLACNELTPSFRRMLVAPPQHWSAP